MWPGISHASSGTLGQRGTKLGNNKWREMESCRRVCPTWGLRSPDDSRGFGTSARVLGGGPKVRAVQLSSVEKGGNCH